MAVNITNEPSILMPAGNPLVFIFSSDQIDEPNFSFIVELFIYGQLRLTQQVFPQFLNYGRIDVSEAVQSYLMTPALTDDLENNIDLPTYSIIVYEKYGTPPVVDLNGSDTSSGLKAFNGAFEYKRWLNFDHTNYSFTFPDINTLFLTDYPRAKKIFCARNENLYLGYLTNVSADYYELKVVLYDINFNELIIDSIPLQDVDMNIVNVGPQALINAGSITNEQFDLCYFYRIQVDVTVDEGALDRTSEELYVYIDLDCKRYTTHRLHWLNKYGSFDSFTFSLVSTESANVQSFGYQRDPGNWNSDTFNYEYGISRGQKLDFAKTKSETLVLNSDWINQDVQQWLVKSLYDSPLVYLELPEVAESDCECVKVTFSYDGVDYEYNVPKDGEGYFNLLITDGDLIVTEITILIEEPFWYFSGSSSIETHPFYGDNVIYRWSSVEDCPKTDQWEYVGGNEIDNLTTSDCYINYEFKFEPVKVTNSSYTLKSRRKDGLIQETVNIERTFTYRSQIN